MSQSGTPLPESPNFQFLANLDSSLARNAILAECYVFSDPNAALFKLRCFADMMTARLERDYDQAPTDTDLSERINQLRFDRELPKQVADWLHRLRLKGNDAAHVQYDSRDAALECLEVCHHIAAWYHKAERNTDVCVAPFVSPPAPSDASKLLKQRIADLRNVVAKYEEDLEFATGQKTEFQTKATRLYHQLQQAKAEADASDAEHQRELQEYRRRLSDTQPVNLRNFIERGKRAVQSLASSDRDGGYVPIAQIRVAISDFHCEGASGILIQYSSGGYVKVWCSGCGETEAFRRRHWKNLDVWVACPLCRQRMEKEFIGSNYGFVCRDCDWKCWLGGILPDYQTVTGESRY